jgi:hypothetical protein
MESARNRTSNGLDAEPRTVKGLSFFGAITNLETGASQPKAQFGRTLPPGTISATTKLLAKVTKP